MKTAFTLISSLFLDLARAVHQINSEMARSITFSCLRNLQLSIFIGVANNKNLIVGALCLFAVALFGLSKRATPEVD